MKGIIHGSCSFSAGHRQYKDKSKCGKLHGHNFKVEFTIEGGINEIGYVVDFKEVKDMIEDRFDHKVILNKNDSLVNVLKDNGQEVAVIDYNPTCEVLSNVISEMILQNTNADKCSVKVYENENDYGLSCR